ncbi:MAG: hypothetical protein RR263_00395 [Oscillospiraceae bacterium]
MKTLIIVVCILIIVLGLLLFVRQLIQMSKGNCCGNCTHCLKKDGCDKSSQDQS